MDLFVEEGDLENIKNLISLGENPREKNDYALHVACANGHLHIVEYLVLIHNADVKSLDDNAIIQASLYGHLEVVKFLISQGADVKAQNNFPVVWASRNGHLEVVKYLISQGAEKSECAFVIAKINGHDEVCNYLL